MEMVELMLVVILIDVSFNAGYDGSNAVMVACGQFHTAAS